MHIGVRVHDLERSVRFCALLGFEKTAGPLGPEPVAILSHPAGVELNLILNAPNAEEPNILMDVRQKHPGITHFGSRRQSSCAIPTETSSSFTSASPHSPSAGAAFVHKWSSSFRARAGAPG